ncbi:MAG: hypothetical protein A2341_20650 [Deltaproteobacteria bacterium RIFOXYB12_FULL_58_9]|nr:MAG: hypothetical protein A2341_20650 [Deltaproteobacteria bacterium RIFOXYB12_FULL_58_9]
MCACLYVERSGAVELAGASGAFTDLCIEPAADEILDHSLVLVLHQVDQQLAQPLAVDDVGIGGLARFHNVSPHKNVGDDVGIVNARVLRLNVEDLVPVPNVVIVSRNHNNCCERLSTRLSSTKS